MTTPKVLTWMVLLVAPAYGQQSNVVPAPNSAAIVPAASSNAVPPAQGLELRTPPLPKTPTEGIETAMDISRTGTAAALDIDKPLQGLDRSGRRALEGADRARFGVQHAAGLTNAYREGNVEGMVVYGAQEGLDKAGEAGGQLAAGAYTAWRAGTLASGPAAAVAGSFWLGTTIGDVIKNTVYWDGKSLESHVTDFWFNNTYGRWADREFGRVTSDEAIELHRQKLRQQRAAQFSSVQHANEQAAANRTIAADQSTSDNAAAMNQMMLQLLPAAIVASQGSAIRPPLAAPPTVASPLPELQYRQRCSSDGRRLGTNEIGPTYCWQEPVYPGSAPTGRARFETLPLGSTFGSQPQTTVTPRGCPPRDQLPNFCRGNAECGGCYQ